MTDKSFKNRPPKHMFPREGGHVKTHQVRIFSAHHMLIQVARESLNQARQRVDNRHLILTTIVMSALAIESLANTVGDRVIERWHDFERLQPLGKLRLVAERLDIAFDRGAEPWQSIAWLFRQRNDFAHPKPETVEGEATVSVEEFENPMDSTWMMPASAIELSLTVENGERAAKVASDLVLLLGSKLKSGDGLGIHGDGASGSATYIPPPEATKSQGCADSGLAEH